MRIFGVLYGALCYVVFLIAVVYAVGFIGGFGVPKTIDSGAVAGWTGALMLDALLLGLFALQHSVMARPAFKRVWTRIVPTAVERSTYVLLSSSILLLLFWQWRPLPQILWATTGVAHAALLGLYGIGWLIVLLSTFMLSHFELFGLEQVWLAFTRKTAAPTTLRRVWLYRFVRHPIMLGFLIAFWATPVMTLGHLVFAIGCTGYILVGVQLEEHDLEQAIGEPYRTYKREVPMLLPMPSAARNWRR
jgi:protein-S-isoprenylcysteine O-methyltransferase Ste14